MKKTIFLCVILAAIAFARLPNAYANGPWVGYDETTVVVALHVGTPASGSATPTVSGGVPVAMRIVSPHTLRYVSVDHREIDASATAGSTLTLSCAYKVSGRTNMPNHPLTAWMIEGSATNDLFTSYGPTHYLQYRTYPATAPARGAFRGFSVGSPSILFTPQNTAATFCVDIKISVPGSAVSGNYYATIAHLLYINGYMGHGPTPTPAPTSTPTPTPAYSDGTIAVFDEGLGDVLIFDGSQNGDVLPIVTITPPWGGTNAIGNGDHGQLTFDPFGNLWIAYGDGSASSGYAAIAEYQPPLSSSSTPVRVISGSATGLFSPTGISFNSSRHSIIVSDNTSKAIYTFDATANGNVAPQRSITGLDAAGAVESDASNIYEAIDQTTGYGLRVFPLGSSGAATPTNVIFDSAWGANTGLTGMIPMFFDYDIYGNLFVVSNYPTVYEFPANVGASTMPSTSVSNASWSGYGVVHTDGGHNLYVLGFRDLQVYGSYSSNSIPTTPSREITSSAWIAPISFAVYSPSRLDAGAPQ